MAKIKVADYIINYIAEKGIKDIFGVYGSAVGDLFDAFTRTDKTRYVCTMHEQAAGFSAETYAKVSGKFGVAIATSGPGGMNFTTPVGNCFYDSVPCLFITGQISSRFLRPDPIIRQVGFQESDMVGIMKPITKYSVMITKAEDVKFELEKALFIMQEGRPGPVHLDIPLDIQKKLIETDDLVGYDSSPDESVFDIDQIFGFIKSFISDLSMSKRPALLIGGGVHDPKAIKFLLQLSNILKIPIFPTWNALDIVTSDFPYYGGRVGTYGGSGRNLGIQNCDLLLAIGSRISGRITGGAPELFARSAKKYIVDIDIANLQKKLQQVVFDYNLRCDSTIFLNMLLDYIEKSKFVEMPDFSQWTEKVMGWKIKYDVIKQSYYDTKDIVHPYVFSRVLSGMVDKDSIIISDCGGNIVIMSQAFETMLGQKFLTNNGNSPMGFSFAASIGAWCASNKKQNVICVIGDGGMNMNIQELQTIKNYGVDVKVFIINNHIYGITKAFQETNFGGRAEACGPVGYKPPDFVKVAEAYGIKTCTINNNSELVSKILDVLNSSETVICDVNCHEYHSYIPRLVGWSTALEDMYPYLDREELKKEMIIDVASGFENPILPDIIVGINP
jgi:acetolactate synthase-1/2/3 large subunit